MATPETFDLTSRFASNNLKNSGLVLILVNKLSRGLHHVEASVNQAFHEYNQEFMSVLLST
jgi:hypothetical protein